MGIYFILFACQMTCLSSPNFNFTNAVNTAVKSGETTTCEPDVIITADETIAEKALASGSAQVWNVSPKLKVFKLTREATYHINKAEQAVPTAP